MKRFKNILLVDEAGQQQNPALERALALAESNQADLTILRVVDLQPESFLLGHNAYERLHRAVLKEWDDDLSRIISGKPSNVNIRGDIIFEGLFPQVVQEVLRSDHDLLMKNAEKKHGLKNRLFGSTDMHLLRKCPCPVWIMKSNENKKYKSIIAAVDVEESVGETKLSGLNLQILEMATSLSLSEFSELHIVHAWKPRGESIMNTPRYGFTEEEVSTWIDSQKESHEKKMNDLMQALDETISRETMEYVKPQVHIIKGNPHDVIPELAHHKNADLIIMGTLARTGVSGLLIGNTAESIINNIDCSVMAVKPPGFSTPVTLDT